MTFLRSLRSSRTGWLLVAAAGVLFGLAAWPDAAPVAAQDPDKPRLLVLGFDGVDSKTTERLLASGDLPNLKKLSEQGAFSALMPTNPAQSPVSWASIATGLGPGNHGIYDFLRRETDSQTDSPDIKIGLVNVDPKGQDLAAGAWRGVIVFALGGVGCLLGGLFGWFVLGAWQPVWRRGGRLQAVALVPGSVLAVGGMVASAWLPQQIPEITNNRSGEPFWQTLDKSGVRCIALEAPVSFPADHMEHGACLAGLGVPDVQQSWGIFSIWTNDPRSKASSETGGTGYFVRPENGSFDLVLRGPPNPVADAEAVAAARKEARLERNTREISYDWTPAQRRASETTESLLKMADRMTVRLPVSVAPDGKTATVTLQDGTLVGLTEGTWTGLLPVRFAANPILKVHALAQLCLVERPKGADGRGPYFEIFVAPVQFDPTNVPPALPLSSPQDYAEELAALVGGPYPTLGWPELTGPVKDDWLADKLFLDHTYEVMAHREKKLAAQLERDDWDVLFAVFTEQDRVQHAMYRHIDPEVPRHEPEIAAEFAGEIDKIYREMDRIVGEAIERVKDGRPTQVIVISDHGFAPFRRGVNLTNFLRAKGYQVAVGGEGSGPSKVEELFNVDKVWFPDVDWSKSKAYGMGLGNIYLNRIGREKGGIVSDVDAPAVLEAIKRDLLELRDPARDNAKVVRNVYFGKDLFPGARGDEAPDIVVGFEWGYRVSWQASLGSLDDDIIVDNPFRWSGDHCSVDPPLVQGIWFSSMPIRKDATPTVKDVGPTVLGLYGLQPPRTDGQDLAGRD